MCAVLEVGRFCLPLEAESFPQHTQGAFCFRVLIFFWSSLFVCARGYLPTTMVAVDDADDADDADDDMMLLYMCFLFNLQGWTMGNIATNSIDTARFFHYLLTAQLLKASTITMMTQWQPFTTGFAADCHGKEDRTCMQYVRKAWFS